MSGWIDQAVQRTKTYSSAQGENLPTRWLVVLALAATAMLLLAMNMEIGVFDESLTMQGAVEIGQGHVPHRDFFWSYGPLDLWIVAAFFAVFGKTMIVARLVDTAIRGAIVLVCGLAARRLGLRPGLVVGVMLIETVLLSISGFYLYPVFPSLLCALTGTMLLVGVRRGAEVETGRLIAAGLLTAAIALIRYDIGVLVLVAHLITLSLFCFQGRRPIRLLVGQVIAYGLSVSVICVPVAIGAWAIGAAPGFVHDIVRFLPANYARMRGLPWPMPGLTLASLLQLICYLPFLAVAWGATLLARDKGFSRETSSLDADRKLAVALLILTALFIFKGLVRMSLIHSMLAMVPAMLILVFMVGRKQGMTAWLGSLAVLAGALALISLNTLSTLRAEWRHGLGNLFLARVTGHIPAGMQRPNCATPPALGLGVVERDTYNAVCYITSHTTAGERIFVGAGRHDKLLASNIAIYYLSERQPATHWYELEPGLQTTAEIQQDIVRDLIGSDVRLIITDAQFDDVKEANNSSSSSGVYILDQFIQSHYRETSRFGKITILERR